MKPGPDERRPSPHGAGATHTRGARSRRGGRSARRVEIARAIAKIVALVVVSLVAGELALRALGARLPWVRALAAPRRERMAEPENIADLQRGYGAELEPGRKFFNFRRNSLGFHDAEFRAPLPPETERIIVLGDSFARSSMPYWNAYLTHAEIGLLERAVRRRPPAPGASPPIELDNLGIGGTGIEDYLRVYRLIGRGLAPSLVAVNVYMGNDLADFASSERFGVIRRTWLRSWLATLIGRAARLLREDATRDERGSLRAAVEQPEDRARDPRPTPIFGRTVEANPEWRDDATPVSLPVLSDRAFLDAMAVELRELTRAGAPGDPHDWPRLRAAIDELVGAIALDGTPVVLVLAPSRLQVDDAERADVAHRLGEPAERFDPDVPRRWLTEYARDRGLALVDLTDRLRREHAAGTRLYLNNDTHWNLAGNRIAGDELAEQLFAVGLVAAEPHRGAHREGAPGDSHR